MHPYRVKEYFWLVVITLFIVVALAGCSSTPKVQAQKPQYCNTSQAMAVRNGETVDSVTVVECTDDRIKQLAVTKAGLAKTCGYNTYWMKVRGQNVQYTGISCQILDSSGRVIGIEQVE